MRPLRTRIVFLLFLLASLTGAAALALSACGSSASDPPPDEIASPFGVYSPGSLDEVPEDAGLMMIEALGLETLADYEQYSIGLLEELGLSWVRIDFLYDEGGFSEPGHLEDLRNRGIDVVGTARPVENSAPADMEHFKRELAALIDRHPWITSWQIGNEPNVFWDVDDYARLFAAGRSVVKEECPDCRVVLGGMAGELPSHEGALAYYRRLLEAIDEENEDGHPFDVVDLHYYGQYGDYRAMAGLHGYYQSMLDQFGQLQGVDFWVTETSTTSGTPQGEDSFTQSEEQQAAELVRRFVSLLGAGVTRIAWARPYENYRYHGEENGYYDHNAIVYNGLGSEAERGVVAGTPKQAFLTYALLVDKLTGFSESVWMAPGHYRFDFDGGRGPVHVLWLKDDSAADPGLTGPVLVTTIYGHEAGMDGSQVVVGEIPVFVEELR